MKILPFFFFLLSLTLCVQVFGQKSNKKEIITALKLKKKSALKFHKGLIIQGFSVDKDGVLRPDKDYEIVILDKTKEFLVKPKGAVFKMSDDFVIIDTDDGAKMVCACGFGAGDDCSANISQDGGDRIYKCVGSCGCGSYFIEPTFNVAQFETAEGY